MSDLFSETCFDFTLIVCALITGLGDAEAAVTCIEPLRASEAGAGRFLWRVICLVKLALISLCFVCLGYRFG